jgi:hypothetical protein
MSPNPKRWLRWGLTLWAVLPLSACERQSPPPPVSAATPAALEPSSILIADAWRRAEGPAGTSELQVGATGPLGAGFFMVGTARVGDQLQRWVALVGPDGQASTESPGPGRLQAACPAADGGLWVAGQVPPQKPHSSLETPALMRLGQKAVERFAVTFRPEVSGDWTALVPSGDGVILAGIHNPLASGVSNGWLAAVDGTGGIRWESRPGAGSYHYLAALTMLGDGNLLAVGAAKAGTYRNWRLRFTPEGTILDEQIQPTKLWEGLTAACPAPDGGAYLIGTRSPEQGEMRSSGAWLAQRVSAAGAPLWELAEGTDFAAVGSPLATADGVAFVGARVDDADQGSLWLIRVGADGKRHVEAELPAAAAMLDFRTPGGFLLRVQGDRFQVLLLRPAAGAVEWKVIEVALAAPGPLPRSKG